MTFEKPELKSKDLWVDDKNFAEAAVLISEEIEKWPAYKIGRKNESTCPMCFDTETTTVEEKYAFIYMFQLQVGHLTIMTRQKDIMMKIFKEIHYICESIKVSCTIGIANIKYEWSFLCRDIEKASNEIEGTDNDKALIYLESYCPLYAFLGKIRFIDILKISASNLAKTGEDYCTTQKLVGDLDYKKIRNSKTKLTDKEIAYCRNDVIVGGEFMYYLHNEYTVNGRKMPLTSTGIVRRLMKDEAYKGHKVTNEKGKKVKVYDYQETFDKVKAGYPALYKDYEKIMKHLFRGGYTHGNSYYCGTLVKNVDHVDYTSDYPACMLQEKYATVFSDKLIYKDKVITALKYKNEKGLNLISKLENNIAFWATVTFYNIRSRYSHSLDSIDKALYLEEDSKLIVDNGRVKRCSKLTVMISEQDYLNFKDLYDWDYLEVETLDLGLKEDLPFYMVNAIVPAYIEKKKLKDAGLPNGPQKKIVNSSYGCTVQRINIESCIDIIEDDEVKHLKLPFPAKFLKLDGDSNLVKKNKKYFDYVIDRLVKMGYGKTPEKKEKLKKAVEIVYGDFLKNKNKLDNENYQIIRNTIIEKLQQRAYTQDIKGIGDNQKMLSMWWGIWVTAYARRRLVKMIVALEKKGIELGFDDIVVYYDTDSLFLNIHQGEEYDEKTKTFKGDNTCYQECKKIIDEYNKNTLDYNIKNLRKYSPEGYLDDLGQFDWEPMATHFKELGAKRYLQRFLHKKTKEYVIESTIAGLNKNDFSKKVNEKFDNVEDKFKFFTDGMVFAEFETSKLSPVYINKPYSAVVTDDEGNSEVMTSLSGQVLRPVGFEMCLVGYLLNVLKTRVG